MVYHFNMRNLLQAKAFPFAVDSRIVFRVDQLPDLLLAREIGITLHFLLIEKYWFDMLRMKVLPRGREEKSGPQSSGL